MKAKPYDPDRKLMKFPEAMAKVIAGAKVTKVEWKDKGFYVFLNGEWLSIHKPDGTNWQWTISSGDLFGEDYVEL